MKKFFRFVSQSSKGTWITASVAFGLIILLGCVFYVSSFGVKGVSFWDYIFAALKLNRPKGDIGSNWVHGLYFVLGLFATLMLPFVTAVLTEWYREKMSLIREGKDIHDDIKEHYVIIGYNRYTVQVIRRCLTGNSNKAILLTPQNPYMVRDAISNGLEKEMSGRVILYAGDAIESQKVESQNLCDALKLYLLDESDKHESRYSRNLSVLKNIVDAVAERSNPLELYMQVNNSRAYNLMQRIDIPKEFFQRGDKMVVDFRPFNFYENWARLIWSYYKLPQYDVLDYEPMEETDKHVHLVIAGFNSMGHALLLEALRLCHYPNFDERKNKNKTIITVFESDWKEQKDAFYSQYPHLDQIKDIEIDFREMDVNSPEARNEMEQWALDNNTLLTVAICDKEADEAMTKALNLPETVFRNNIRVLVRQELEKVNTEIFAFDDQKRAYPHIRFFGMLQEGLDFKQLDDRLAMCIGGIYSFYREEPFNLSDAEKFLECQQKIQTTLAQKSKAEWYEDWLKTIQTDKWSSRFQSDIFHTYISLWERHKGISTKEFDQWQEVLADMEHRRWIAERTVYGFRKTRGNETKDKTLKVHPDIIPYAELDNDTKNYDRNIVNTAPLIVKEVEKYNRRK